MKTFKENFQSNTQARMVEDKYIYMKLLIFKPVQYVSLIEDRKFLKYFISFLCNTCVLSHLTYSNTYRIDI